MWPVVSSLYPKLTYPKQSIYLSLLYLHIAIYTIITIFAALKLSGSTEWASLWSMKGKLKLYLFRRESDWQNQIQQGADDVKHFLKTIRFK